MHNILNLTGKYILTVWFDLSIVFCFSDDCLPNYGNIMFDKRVVRGNTYSQNVFAVCIYPSLVFLAGRFLGSDLSEAKTVNIGIHVDPRRFLSVGCQ